MDSRLLRLLIIEDNADDAVLMVYELTKAGYDVVHTVVDTEAEVRKLLKEGSWDCITSDHKMPQFSAPDAVRVVREMAPDAPLVIVSGELDIDLAVNLLKSGADDYVQKRDLPLVVKAVECAIERSVTRVKQKVEKKKSEKRERLLRSYFDLPYIGAAIVGCETATVEANDTLCQLLGLDKIELIGKSLSEIVYFEDQERYRDCVNQLCSASGQAVDTELRLSNKDNITIPVKLVARKIAIEGDDQDFLLFLILDQSKKAELVALAENRGNLLAAIGRTSPFAIYLFNVKTLGFVYASPQAQAMFGFSEQEMIDLGKEIWNHRAHPEDLAEFDHYQKFMSQLSDNETVSSHFRLIHKDGTYHRYICHESVYSRDEGGLTEIVFGIQSDITALMQLESELKDSNLRLDRIVSATGIGVVNVDCKGTILVANEVISRILGFTSEELKNRNISDMIKDEDVLHRVQDCCEKMSSQEDLCQFVLGCQDGAKYTARASMHFLETSKGSECLIIIHDCQAN